MSDTPAMVQASRYALLSLACTLARMADAELRHIRQAFPGRTLTPGELKLHLCEASTLRRESQELFEAYNQCTCDNMALWDPWAAAYFETYPQHPPPCPIHTKGTS